MYCILHYVDESVDQNMPSDPVSQVTVHTPRCQQGHHLNEMRQAENDHMHFGKRAMQVPAKRSRGRPKRRWHQERLVGERICVGGGSARPELNEDVS